MNSPCAPQSQGISSCGPQSVKDYTKPFVAPGCMSMNLEFSYHLWCEGHSSSLSSTIVLIGHLHVEANCIESVLEKISSFQKN